MPESNGAARPAAVQKPTGTGGTIPRPFRRIALGGALLLASEGILALPSQASADTRTAAAMPATGTLTTEGLANAASAIYARMVRSGALKPVPGKLSIRVVVGDDGRASRIIGAMGEGEFKNLELIKGIAGLLGRYTFPEKARGRTVLYGFDFTAAAKAANKEPEPESLSALLKPGRIIVYGSPGCSACVVAKHLLGRKGMEFEYRDIASHEAYNGEVVKIVRLRPDRSLRVIVPVIIIHGQIFHTTFSFDAKFSGSQARKIGAKSDDEVGIGLYSGCAYVLTKIIDGIKAGKQMRECMGQAIVPNSCK